MVADPKPAQWEDAWWSSHLLSWVPYRAEAWACLDGCTGRACEGCAHSFSGILRYWLAITIRILADPKISTKFWISISAQLYEFQGCPSSPSS